MTAPFDTAESYRALGWTGTIPLPPAQKWPPPPGFTGDSGRWPTAGDLARLRSEGYRTRGTSGALDHHAASNIALRLPPNVVGLDVDHYGDKTGGDTLAALEDKLGALPATWRTTSRDDGCSGIRLYRVPTGPSWPTEAGQNIEIIRYGHRYAVAAPSIHKDTGATYRWLGPDGDEGKPPRPGDLPELPDAWVAYLTGTGSNGSNGAARPGSRGELREAHKAGHEWLTTLPADEPCTYVGKLAADCRAAALREDGSAYDHTMKAVMALLRAGERGHHGVPVVLDRTRAAYVQTVAKERDTRSAQAEFARFTDGGAAKILATPNEHAGQGCDCVEDWAGVGAVATLEHVMAAVSRLHHVTDTGPIRFALAVAVSSVLDEEPLWGMHVGPPASGKTVTQGLLGDVVDDQVDELTVAGLLTWSKGGKKGVTPRPVGLLPRIGASGFATIGDFSTILAGSDRNGRDQLFGDLRRVYDGSLSRNMDSHDGKPLRWTGRLTLLAAVTPEIDRYSSHGDALGPRWLYIRTGTVTVADKRQAARKARRRDSAGEERKTIRAAASALVATARDRVPSVDISDDAHDALEDAALVACWGRASVPRQTWGRREVDGVVVIEEPPRLVRQLVTLTRCLVAVGDTERAAVHLARRCALDTVPAARRDVLARLSDGEALTVSDLARATGHHRDVVRRALEDMQIVGVTSCPIREEAEVDQDDPYNRTQPAPWQLRGHDGELVGDVLTAHLRGA